MKCRFEEENKNIGKLNSEGIEKSSMRSKDGWRMETYDVRKKIVGWSEIRHGTKIVKEV